MRILMLSLLLAALSVSGCSQPSQQAKSSPKGFPVRVFAHSEEGLPVRLAIDPNRALPVQLKPESSSPLPVQLQSQPDSPLPVQVNGGSGLAVRLQTDVNAPLPVQLQVNEDKPLPVEIETRGGEPLPVQFGLPQLPPQLLVLLAIAAGASFLSALLSAVAVVLACQAVKRANSRSGEKLSKD